MSVIGNSIVLFVVYKSKQLRHSQYVYNCSIAVSDIIWGFTLSYYFILFFVKLLEFDPIYLREILYYRNGKFVGKKLEISRGVNNTTILKYQYDHVKLMADSIFFRFSLFNRYLSMVLKYLSPVTLLVSFISLLFSSIDRYVSLTFPFRYKQMNSIKIAKRVSVFIWLLSAIITAVTLYLSFMSPQKSFFFQPLEVFYRDAPDQKDPLNHHLAAAILLILFFSLWTFTFLTLYSLYKSYKRSSYLNKRIKKSVSFEKQMGLILIFMVVAFTFSLSPTIYLNVCFYFAPHKTFSYENDYSDTLLDDKNFFISVAFLTTNSVWNFVIYNILNKKFRSALIKACFKCK